MKKILILAAAAASLTLAAGGANAQPFPDHRAPPPASHAPPHDRGDSRDRFGAHGRFSPAAAIDARRNELAGRIARGERSHRLSRPEVRRLRGDLDHIAQLERRFQRSRGLDRREVAILDERLDRLERQIAAAMRDHGRRGDRH